MKSFQTQTHYELLEVSVGASAADVRAAFDRLSALYADDQVALYGLIDAAQASALRARLHEAAEVLSDDDRRDAYDRSIGLPPRERPHAVEPPPRVAPRAPSVSTGPAATSSAAWAGSFSYVSAPPAPPPTAPPPVVLTVPAPRVLAPLPTPPPLVPLPPVRQLPHVEPRASVPPVIASPAASPPAARPSATPPPLAPAEAAPPPIVIEAIVPPAPIDETPRLADDAIVTLVPARAPSREFRVEPKVKPYEVPDGVEFNGDLLRQVRMARGLSMAQLSDRTRISARHLENVEGDRYDALPATVYLRGILMNLARELGLDGLRVSKSYLTFVEAHRSKG